MLQNVAISIRLLFIVGAAMLGISAVGIIGLLNLKQELLSDRQDAIKNLVESANSVASHHAATAAG